MSDDGSTDARDVLSRIFQIAAYMLIGYACAIYFGSAGWDLRQTNWYDVSVYFWLCLWPLILIGKACIWLFTVGLLWLLCVVAAVAVIFLGWWGLDIWRVTSFHKRLHRNQKPPRRGI